MHNRITAVAGTKTIETPSLILLKWTSKRVSFLVSFRYEVKQALHDNATFCLEQGKVGTDRVDELVHDYVVDGISGEIFKLICPGGPNEMIV